MNTLSWCLIHCFSVGCLIVCSLNGSLIRKKSKGRSHCLLCSSSSGHVLGKYWMNTHHATVLPCHFFPLVSRFDYFPLYNPTALWLCVTDYSSGVFAVPVWTWVAFLSRLRDTVLSLVCFCFISKLTSEHSSVALCSTLNPFLHILLQSWATVNAIFHFIELLIQHNYITFIINK